MIGPIECQACGVREATASNAVPSVYPILAMVAPMPPRCVLRAERRTISLEASAPQRISNVITPHTHEVPFGNADFTNGLWQSFTYLASSSPNRGSPGFTTSAFTNAALSSGFSGRNTCGAAQVKSM